MKIVRDFQNTYFSLHSRMLGNCFLIYDQEKEYHYEFILTGKNATIKADTELYLEEITEAFRCYNKGIEIFSNENHSFYKAYDPVQIFLLPIKILQISHLALNKMKSEYFDQHYDYFNMPVAVTIINDEYVLVDGHHRCYAAWQNHIKMIPVYMEQTTMITEQMVYIAKENNLLHVNDLKLLSEDEYQNYVQQLEQLFSN